MITKGEQLEFPCTDLGIQNRIASLQNGLVASYNVQDTAGIWPRTSSAEDQP